MPSLEIPQPSRIYRGTVEEVFSHRYEIPDGATVELQVFDTGPKVAEETATMALMRSWLEEDATEDLAEKQVAAQELDEFKRSMNQPRKEAGARLLYPEVE
jgi:hypothetical protein